MKQLNMRFGPLSTADEERVRTASIEELDAFAGRVLTAGSLSEVLSAS